MSSPPDAAPTDAVQRPQDWEKCVSVAYLRLTGSTQEQAALAAGCGERTIREWETCSWWAAAEAEASGRWLRGMDARARDAIDRSFDDSEQYATTARWWLDRRVPELAPPKLKAEVAGPGGGPLELRHIRDLPEDKLREIAAQALAKGDDDDAV